MSSTAEKRCLYKVLGVSRDCTDDEIRSAYKRQALRCHPDKLMQSGMSSEVATASFQVLSNAYEVLSDPKQRSQYDAKFSQTPFSSTVFSNPKPKPKPFELFIPNLSSFFSKSDAFSGYSDTGKGFYKVYGDAFDKIYRHELISAAILSVYPSYFKKAPSMGNLDSPYEEVSEFYEYWLWFSSVLAFWWEGDEDEIEMYSYGVRCLARLVRRTDKRVIDMKEKKKEEKKKRDEKRRVKQKMGRAAKWDLEYEEQYEYEYEYEYDYDDDEDDDDEDDQDEDEDRKDEFKIEIDVNSKVYKYVHGFYCIACVKKFNFKSDAQREKHEQSNKHRGKACSHVERETTMQCKNMKSNMKKDKSSRHSYPFSKIS